MTEKFDPITNEHILEIRYRPNPRILDSRGTLAEQISTEMALKQWGILENRVDVFADDHTEHAFVGFRNAGFTASDTSTKNFFPDRASKLFRFLFTLKAFGDELFVERLGIRSRFCTPFSGSFERLVEVLASRYVTLTSDARAAIGAGARLIDIGAPLNFADRLGNFNTDCGPMDRKQLAERFRKDEGFPDVGLYYDIDYFIKQERVLSGKEVLATIKSCAGEAWDRHERVKALIFGA